MPRSIAEQVGVMDEPDPAQQALTAQQNGQPPAADRPEWLPENFKNPEELVKSYDESRREMARAQTQAQQAQQAVQELAQQMEDLRVQQQRLQQPQPGYDPASDPQAQQLIRAFEDADSEQFLRALDARAFQVAAAAWELLGQQQGAQQTPGQGSDPALYASVVVQEMKNRYGDEWTPELQKEVGDAAQPFLNENLPFQETIQRLTFVTDAIRHRKLAEQTQQLDAQQHAAAQTKRLAQSAPGGSGRLPGAKDPADALMERWSQMPRPYWAQGA